MTLPKLRDHLFVHYPLSRGFGCGNVIVWNILVRITRGSGLSDRMAGTFNVHKQERDMDADINCQTLVDLGDSERWFSKVSLQLWMTSLSN